MESKRVKPEELAVPREAAMMSSCVQSPGWKQRNFCSDTGGQEGRKGLAMKKIKKTATRGSEDITSSKYQT